MEGAREFLDDLRQRGLATGRLLGVLHVLIGRRIAKADGTVVSTGLTWRAASQLLKKVRFDRDAVRELGLDPDALPPRDRERFWYSVIAHAQISSAAAVAAGEELVKLALPHGYQFGPPPRL